MQKPCFRCEGEGFLPEFSHIKGGVCFTCGGDGVVETYPPRKTKQMDAQEYRSFVSYMTTEDIAGTDLDNLTPEQQDVVYSHMKDKAERMTKSGIFSKEEKDAYANADFETLQKDILPRMQKKLVDAIPRPYEDTPYFKKGVITMVPTAWAMKFQGNRLRYDVGTDLMTSIVENGMNEVPYFSIGQEDRHVKVGEGNHRMNVYNELGLDFIPMRVVRSRFGEESGSHAYDKMSRVPKNDYFKADSSPDEVFDTFYDGGEYREATKTEAEVNRDEVQKLVQKFNDESFLSSSDTNLLVEFLNKMDADTHAGVYSDGIDVIEKIEEYSDEDDFDDDFEDDEDF